MYVSACVRACVRAVKVEFYFTFESCFDSRSCSNTAEVFLQILSTSFVRIKRARSDRGPLSALTDFCSMLADGCGSYGFGGLQVAAAAADPGVVFCLSALGDDSKAFGAGGFGGLQVAAAAADPEVAFCLSILADDSKAGNNKNEHTSSHAMLTTIQYYRSPETAY